MHSEEPISVLNYDADNPTSDEPKKLSSSFLSNISLDDPNYHPTSDTSESPSGEYLSSSLPYSITLDKPITILPSYLASEKPSVAMSVVPITLL